MIAPQELMALKARLLKGSDAAGKIASSSDPLVYEDEEEFAQVYQALIALKSDVVRVLAELDVLRGMFSERLSSFFMEVANGVAVSRGDVAAVPAPEAGVGGEGERQEPAGSSGGVPKSRVRRQRATGSKPRRNRKSDRGAEEPVGSSDRTE
jgi:hypothetical protein